MVTGPKVEMKENPWMKMESYHELQWTATRRPQTAVWKIPKSDVRRDHYSKSATGHGPTYDIQVTYRGVRPAGKGTTSPILIFIV